MLIADEMGCGKSAQAIRLCLEYAVKPRADCVPHPKVHVGPEMKSGSYVSAPRLHRGRADREAVAHKGVRFVIVTYSLFTESSQVASAVRRKFRVVVVDESH